jgi:hypothetical protein
VELSLVELSLVELSLVELNRYQAAERPYLVDQNGSDVR